MYITIKKRKFQTVLKKKNLKRIPPSTQLITEKFNDLRSEVQRIIIHNCIKLYLLYKYPVRCFLFLNNFFRYIF